MAPPFWSPIMVDDEFESNPCILIRKHDGSEQGYQSCIINYPEDLFEVNLSVIGLKR
jgi:hypothetical protein